jgi:hypothetical protein
MAILNRSEARNAEAFLLTNRNTYRDRKRAWNRLRALAEEDPDRVLDYVDRYGELDIECYSVLERLRDFAVKATGRMVHCH